MIGYCMYGIDIYLCMCACVYKGSLISGTVLTLVWLIFLTPGDCFVASEWARTPAKSVNFSVSESPEKADSKSK